MAFWVLAASVIIIDQGSKLYIASLMTMGESRILIDGFLYLTYIRNQGASFGMLQGKTWLFIGLACIVIAAIIYCQSAFSLERWPLWSLALITGGTAGNLIDRLRFGAVQDFIDLGWWPIFNFADMAIIAGGILLGLCLLMDQSGQERD